MAISTKIGPSTVWNACQKLQARCHISKLEVAQMVRGALPPVIALAAYEASAWSQTFTTLGYLTAIIASWSVPFLQRAAFWRMITFSVLFAFVGAALGALQIYSVVKARTVKFEIPTHESTADLLNFRPPYDTSVNVISAVWLFLIVFLANWGKAAYPWLTIPFNQYCVFAVVVSEYAPSFATVHAGLEFVWRMLFTFLTGFVLAAGVNLIVFPLTSRSLALRYIDQLLDSMQDFLLLLAKFTQIELAESAEDLTTRKTAASELRKSAKATAHLYGKVQKETNLAMGEVAFGKLKPSHFKDLQSLLGDLVLLNHALAGIPYLLASDHNPSQYSSASNSSAYPDDGESCTPFEDRRLLQASAHSYVASGLEHIAIGLESRKSSAAPSLRDEESPVDSSGPGTPQFTSILREQMGQFYRDYDKRIANWLQGDEAMAKEAVDDNDEGTQPARLSNLSKRRQVEILMCVGHLEQRLSSAVVRLMEWVDARRSDGTMSKTKLRYPTWRETLSFYGIGLSKRSSQGTVQHMKRREKFSPSRGIGKVLNTLRMVSNALNGKSAGFGFRVAVATMSIAIIGFVRPSRNFFFEQRGYWAVISCATAMDPLLGQSIFSYFARLFGTFLAALASLSIWYMCDGQHVAVIICSGLCLMLGVLLLLRHTVMITSSLVASATFIMIVGYELQKGDIGLLLASRGGEYHPMYVFAPLRLLILVIGIVVAFFWTVFPYPLTARTSVRSNVGAMLLRLSEYYFSVYAAIAETTQKKLDTMSANRLETNKWESFGTTLLLITSSEEHLWYTKFEPAMGDQFSLRSCADIVLASRRLLLCLSLLSPATLDVGLDHETREDANTGTIQETAIEVDMDRHLLACRHPPPQWRWSASVLSMLAASVLNSRPWIPRLETLLLPTSSSQPHQYRSQIPTTARVGAVGHYRALILNANLQRVIEEELVKLIGLVTELVGVKQHDYSVGNSISVERLVNTASD